MKRVGLLVVCAVAAASCGGGGGSGVAVHPATTYRSNIVGDGWDYAVAIDLGKEGSGTGTLTNALSTDTYNNAPSIRDTQTFSFTLKSGLTVNTSYSESSDQGVLLATMSNGTLYAVTGDTFETGNTIGPTTSSSGVITLSNGDTLTETYKVIGAELCDTPAGQFATWVVSQKVVDADGIIDNFTLWIAPETGNFVKIHDITTTPIGTAYSYTATLTTIFNALPPPGATSFSQQMALPRLRIR